VKHSYFETGIQHLLLDWPDKIHDDTDPPIEQSAPKALKAADSKMKTSMPIF
jgi:hypothetical protein